MIGRRPAATPGERALRPGGPVAGWRQGLHTSAIGSICALALAAVGCGPTGIPATTAGVGAGASQQAPTALPSAVRSPRPSATAAPTSVGQTSTDWGRIWDDLPASFPRYPGAETTEPVEGPASATLALPAGSADAGDWYANALRVLGYRVDQSTPLEDGSSTIDATGRGSCRVEITLTPRGTVVFATILYGAACPLR